MENEEEPKHIRRQWWPVIARMQGAAGTQNGLAILSIQIIVDEAGNPVFWREPVITRLEPRSKAEIIQSLLTGP